MTRTNGKTNPRLITLISRLKETSRKNEAAVWRDIADRLEAPSRNYAEVNLSKLSRYARDGETYIVPGKVLGTEDGKAVVLPGHLEDCSLCRLCERACLSASIGAESSIRVSADPARFIFSVEGDGSLPVLEVLSTALAGIRRRATELEAVLAEVSGREAS